MEKKMETARKSSWSCFRMWKSGRHAESCDIFQSAKIQKRCIWRVQRRKFHARKLWSGKPVGSISESYIFKLFDKPENRRRNSELPKSLAMASFLRFWLVFLWRNTDKFKMDRYSCSLYISSSSKRDHPPWCDKLSWPSCRWIPLYWASSKPPWILEAYWLEQWHIFGWGKVFLFIPSFCNKLPTKMNRPVIFTDSIRPLCLPSPDLVIPAGTPCVVSGWGRTRKGGKISERLNEVAVKLMTAERCRTYDGYANQLTDSMICAGYEKGGRDACSGESFMISNSQKWFRRFWWTDGMQAHKPKFTSR